MCNCFDDMLDRVSNSIKEKLQDEPMVEGSLRIDWKNRVFFLEGKNNPPRGFISGNRISTN